MFQDLDSFFLSGEQELVARLALRYLSLSTSNGFHLYTLRASRIH